MLAWIALAEDGKWYIENRDLSEYSFDTSLIGKKAKAWTFGISTIQSMAVKIVFE
ncbi:hypothetical protein [Cohnella cholangitidis]|uniref:hypothetical protein n=1 Tax=Cohnella cholangitidis TaxID=2598458 RepID=UPI0015FC206B|nr:hypothetical protein [Cohnella cholangitidis]